MKKYSSIYILLLAIALLMGCVTSNEDTEDVAEEPKETPSPSAVDEPQTTPENRPDFDFGTISETDKLTGAFPYFQLPAGYAFTDPRKNHGEGTVQDYDMEFFLMNGLYQPVEGKTFKAEIVRNFDNFIATIGGVKVNDKIPIPAEEKKRMREGNPEAHRNGYLHSSNNYSDVPTISSARQTNRYGYNTMLGKQGLSKTPWLCWKLMRLSKV